MTYTDKFINFYKNVRSAFTGKLYEEIEEEEIKKYLPKEKADMKNKTLVLSLNFHAYLGRR